MEGTKFYAATVPVSSGMNENEKRTIMICNAASIGVAKCLNRYNPDYLTMQDFEDAVLEAQISALTHINQSASTGLAYADACGRSSAIKKCKSITKQNSIFTPLEYCNGDGDWSINSTAQKCLDESCADSRLTNKEEQVQKAIKDAIIRTCFERLSDTDRMVVILKEKKTPYKEIAKSVGCSTGAIQKRVSDIAKRFNKMLSQSGYYRL